MTKGRLHMIDGGKMVQEHKVSENDEKLFPEKNDDTNCCSEGKAVDEIHQQALDEREPDYPVHPIFLKRWSPRSFQDRPVEIEKLMLLFEAARWAPSTYNEQEWRFLYVQQDSSDWSAFFDCLVDANQEWASEAAVLLCICSKKKLSKNDKENPVRSFDCGAAFQNLALQASEIGLVVHGMAGFHKEKVRTNLKVPDDFAIEAMAAVGYPAGPERLPEDLQEKEEVSSRKPIKEIAAAGVFNFAQ